MTKLAAIAAQLVDVRNVGTHKVVKLTIHVPEEQATMVFDAFGWPTGTHPVPVAIARLNAGAEPASSTPAVSDSPTAANQERVRSQTTTGNRSDLDREPHQADPTPPSGGDRRRWDDMSPAQQSGMLCADKSFQRFLYERCHIVSPTEDQAAEAVRSICGVKSRKEIAGDRKSQATWRDLVIDYRIWERALV